MVPTHAQEHTLGFEVTSFEQTGVLHEGNSFLLLEEKQSLPEHHRVCNRASAPRISARSPSLQRGTDSPPWMKPCRVSWCMSPTIGKKTEEGFPTTLLKIISARWTLQWLGMLAGGSSIVALMVLEYLHAPDAEPVYHMLSSESAALTFRWYNTAIDTV